MDQQELQAARDGLAGEQARVALLAAELPPSGWRVQLPAEAAAELLALGHFGQYETELDWTPQQVVGHLRDSARIFTSRVRALQTGDEPLLNDFVTDDPARLRDYATRTPAELRAELDIAQQQLRQALAAVSPAQLACRGRHEVDGPLTLADVVAFLPGHQRDHAEQLARLAAAARAAARLEPDAASQAQAGSQQRYQRELRRGASKYPTAN